jgi:uncharacterized BrkB/YihY/UPF0761 family membrane protein
MKHLSKLTKAASLICGIFIAALGLVWLWISASGDLRPAPGIGYFASAALLVVAAPFLAFPFNRRFAKILAIFALLLSAFASLWLACRPGQPLERPASAQAAAIALVVLLVARIGLAWYRRRAGLAT